MKHKFKFGGQVVEVELKGMEEAPHNMRSVLAIHEDRSLEVVWYSQTRAVWIYRETALLYDFYSAGDILGWCEMPEYLGVVDDMD